MSFGFYSTYVALWGLVLFQTLVLWGLLRRFSEMSKKMEEGVGVGPSGRLPLGSEASDFRAREMRTGTHVGLADLRGHKSILLFISPSCRTCDRLADSVHGLLHKADGYLYAVCRSDRESCLRFAETHGLRIPVLLDESGEIFASFRVTTTPEAILLDEEVKIRSYGAPKSAEDVLEILDQASPQAGEPSRAPLAEAS